MVIFGVTPKALRIGKKCKKRVEKIAPDYRGYVLGRNTVEALDITRQFFVCEAKANKVLNEFEKEGIIEIVEKHSMANARKWKVI